MKKKRPDSRSRSHALPAPSAETRQSLLALYRSGKLQPVISESEKLIENYPSHPFAYHLLGVALRRLNKNREAAQCLEIACRLSPGNSDMLNSLAKVYCNLQAYDKARASLENVLSLKPQDGQTRLLMCRAMIGLGDLPEALAQGRQAVELDPGNYEAHYYYSSALKHAGQLPIAVIHGREATALRLAIPPGAPVPRHKGGFDSAGNELLLWRVLTRFAAAGIHGFATAGTLLGLVRDGALLPFDKDMDVALPFREMNAAARCLEADGWKEDHRSFGLINPRSFVHQKTGFVVDLCGLIAETDTTSAAGGFWMANIPKEWNRFTEFPPVQLKKVRRREGHIWSLVHPEQWLESLYGDWRTPDPHFDTVLCAKNLRGFSLLTECFAWQRTVAMLESGQLRKAEAIARACLRHQPDESLWQLIIEYCQKAG
ncbi:MAG: tetratricopeptide repeat protein [Porticoccaceae bacterium]|nr:tetratricopeptide repeat protein [Porticoccaceae bacterium]